MEWLECIWRVPAGAEIYPANVNVAGFGPEEPWHITAVGVFDGQGPTTGHGSFPFMDLGMTISK